MRVLLLTQYYAPEVGAPHVRLGATVRQLIAAGHEVEIVTAMPNHPTGRIFPEYRRKLLLTEQRDGATVRRVWVFAALGSGAKRMVTFASFATMSLLGLLRSRRPDVILVESPPLFVAIPAMLYGALRRAPYVLLIADLWPDAAVDLGLLKSRWLSRAVYGLERLAYRRALALSPVTEGQIATLRDAKGIADERIVFMPNGVDLDMFAPRPPDPAMQRELAPNGEAIILYAGTHGYAHAMDTIVDAGKILVAQRPDARLVLVGAGSEKQRIAQRVEDEGLGNVVLLDPRPVEDIARMLTVARIGLATVRSSPVFDDARSSKMFPVMASGVPIVYSGAGEGPRLVEAAGAGIVTPPEDAAALAAAIVRLLDDPEMAARLGAAGRRFTEDGFSWEVIVRRFIDRLERLL